MPNHAKPTPKHRGTPKHAHLKEAPKKAVRNTVLFSGVALAVTGIAVGGGVLESVEGEPATGAAADLDGVVTDLAPDRVAVDTGNRAPVVSRDDHRAAADPNKRAGLVQGETAAMTQAETLSESAPRDIARALLGDFGFGQDQFGCLDSLWTRESNWNVYADNPTSSAYGIPQALPGSKMPSAGADWADNPVTQITWGLGYIQDRYGSPCGAWSHSESNGWY